jgi:hypothetical protein
MMHARRLVLMGCALVLVVTGMRRMFSDGRCDLPVTPSLRGWAGGATRRLHGTRLCR